LGVFFPFAPYTAKLPDDLPKRLPLSTLAVSITRATKELGTMQADKWSIRRTIRRHQLREMVPLADSTIYEMEQRGEFPRRFALSPRCIVWDLAEVEAWLMARRAAPIRRAQHPDVTKRKTRPIKGRDQGPSPA
jgi:prophage regulatory protein